MIKILMILSLAAMIVTGVFGWQNRQTFVEVRKAKHKTNKAIELLKEKVVDEVQATKRKHEELTTTEGLRDVSFELLRSAKTKLAGEQSKLAGLEGDVMAKEKQLADLQKKLDEFQAMIAEALGSGIKIDDIEPKYKELQKIVETSKEELVQLGKELDVAKENLANKIKDRKGLESKQEKRKEEFKLNTLNARVTEVSNDWGFLVIDAGSNQQIAGDTQLMVIRPGQGGIAKLSITSIDETKTTANILQNSLAPGEQIRVGDRVIISTPRD